MKKNIKNTKILKSTTVTEFKPAYVIDLTECYTIEDTIEEIALAKVDSMLNTYEFAALSKFIIDTYKDVLLETADVFTISGDEKVEISADGVKVKKPNVFKRFWNWITRK